MASELQPPEPHNDTDSKVVWCTCKGGGGGGVEARWSAHGGRAGQSPAQRCALQLSHAGAEAVAAARLQLPVHIKFFKQRVCACAREAQDRLERAWWEEKAELSAGPAEQGAGGRFSDAAQEPESGHTSWQAGT